MARIGDPDAPMSFNGASTSINRSECNFSRLQRFSIIKMLLDNKILCALKLVSSPGSIPGLSIATALTFFQLNNLLHQ